MPRRQDQVINLPKVDYQINERERLSVLYNRMRYSSPNGLYSQSTDNEGRSGWGNDNVNSRYQPTPGLAPADVPKLKLKWSFGFPPADVRTEVTTAGDGASTTRVLIRSACLQGSRRQR